ncbi:asparagine synthase (glutamine-hydrolyzing) [Candidatus Woesearchaeota archaeon]|nr:asparagine synthase (glutamine-hydrolyzing) [Candidatus Woesearchaeota archaeon]
MCGICGFNWDDKGLIIKMARALSHRGPNDTGYCVDKKVSLGHKRLSIIDLSKAGHQPMRDGKLSIVYNGEIYNYREIRAELEAKGYKFKSNTDTEVIIHAYKEYGPAALQKFNGMFAFCIYDQEKQILFLARDRIGIKPLYYFLDGKSFVFASEIKAILKHNIPRKVNVQALNEYIALRYNPTEQTLFEGIKKMPPSTYAIFHIKTSKLELKKYWAFDWKVQNKNERALEQELDELLKDSVSKRLISDVPLGVFLSGGVDSSAIVAMMRQVKNDTEPIRTFSVGFEQGEQVNETEHAKYISELFGTKHTEFMVSPKMVKLLPKIAYAMDEPQADPALIPLYLLSERAAKKVTVVLTGDGGDEVFGGYDHYKFMMMARKLSKIPLASTIVPSVMKLTPKQILNKLYKHASNLGPEGVKRTGRFVKEAGKDPAKSYYELVGIFDEQEQKDVMQQFRPINYKKLNEKYFSRKADILKLTTHFDLRRLLPESFLMKTDRMTMAHSLEARVPLLDHRIAQFGFSVPSKYKIRHGITKYLLRKTAAKYIPGDFLFRKKQTFHVPIENWLEGELKPYSRELLSKESMKTFKQREIEKMFERYKTSKLFYARQMWNLINYQLWYEEFMT